MDALKLSVSSKVYKTSSDTTDAYTKSSYEDDVVKHLISVLNSEVMNTFRKTDNTPEFITDCRGNVVKTDKKNI